MVELIEGTGLPVYTDQSAKQPEGRSPVLQGSAPSLFEKITSRDDISPTEAHVVGAALRAWDRAPKSEEHEYVVASGTTDGTTGNLVLPLYEVKQGAEGHISNLLIDIPGSTSITPAAPFANAASWAFIAAMSPGASANNQASAFRAGMVAFAPTSAGGPILPGNWTFNDSNAPIARGGRSFYLVIIGGSIAAITAQTVVCRARINLYST